MSENKDYKQMWEESKEKLKRNVLMKDSYNQEQYFLPPIVYEWLVKEMESNGGRIHLVMADGAFGIEGKEDIQEFLTSRVILNEIFIGISLAEESFVCKIFDSVNSITRDLLLIVACCFRDFWIFKPVSSRPGNSERYLIAKEPRKEVCQYYAQILKDANNLYSGTNQIISLFSRQDIPEEFINYLKLTNEENISRQLFYAKQVLQMAIGRKIFPPRINVSRVFAMWNLPSNIDPFLKNKNLEDDEHFSWRKKISAGRVPDVLEDQVDDTELMERYTQKIKIKTPEIIKVEERTAPIYEHVVRSTVQEPSDYRIPSYLQDD